jgi:hypothetical protein
MAYRLPEALLFDLGQYTKMDSRISLLYNLLGTEEVCPAREDVMYGV